MKERQDMCVENKQLYRKLSIYLDMGQSIAIVDAADEEHKEIITSFQNDVVNSQETVYIDFKTVSSPCSLAKKIVNQCLNIISGNRKMGISEDTDMDYDDYYYLEKVLLLLQRASEEISKNIVFICDNFTEILGLEKGKQMQEYMRSVFQHQDICFIFRCSSRLELNKIFMDPSAPFFRFASIIDPATE